MNRATELARDPVTGVTELHAPPSRSEKPSADELVDQIRGTRARLTAIVDELEERLAPARIADEVKDSIRDTIDDVRDQIHPRQMAKRAGDNMLETIKENPIPALAAGLSIGYLLMKGMEGGERAERRRFTRSGYEPYSSVPWRPGREDRPWEYDSRYDRDLYASPNSGQEFDSRSSDEHESMREQVAHRAEDIRNRVSERSDEIRHRVGDTTDQVRRSASHAARRAGRQARDMGHRIEGMGHRIEHGARKAENSIEDFVHENPFLAGLITAGIGAIVGAALPSTRREDELLGHARDQVMDTAKEVMHEKSDQAREVARRVGEEAKHHAEDLAETAKLEARSIAKSDGSQSQMERERNAVGSAERPPDSPF